MRFILLLMSFFLLFSCGKKAPIDYPEGVKIQEFSGYSDEMTTEQKQLRNVSENSSSKEKTKNISIIKMGGVGVSKPTKGKVGYEYRSPK